MHPAMFLAEREWRPGALTCCLCYCYFHMCRICKMVVFCWEHCCQNLLLKLVVVLLSKLLNSRFWSLGWSTFNYWLIHTWLSSVFWNVWKKSIIFWPQGISVYGYINRNCKQPQMLVYCVRGSPKQLASCLALFSSIFFRQNEHWHAFDKYCLFIN